MRVIRWLLAGVAGLIGLIGCVGVLARFADGPVGPFPGGRLSGVRVTEPVTDWAPILAGLARFEVQVNPARPRSVTTSYLLHDRTLYVPSMFAARKRWPKEVLVDGRVVLRIRGKLYERHAVRVTDPDEVRPLVRRFDGAAGADADVRDLSTWYFRMDAP